MRKWLMLSLCVAALLPQTVLAIAASQAWVSNYVAQAISASRAELRANTTVTSTNGVTVIESGSGGTSVRLVIEEASDIALKATNCTATAIAQGVTNGCTFVWNGAGAYINPLGVISCTSSNFVFSGIGSFPTNGVDRFAGLFDAYGVRIQPHTSLAITNGMTGVAQ